jgi:hypothetical protein
MQAFLLRLEDEGLKRGKRLEEVRFLRFFAFSSCFSSLFFLPSTRLDSDLSLAFSTSSLSPPSSTIQLLSRFCPLFVEMEKRWCGRWRKRCADEAHELEREGTCGLSGCAILFLPFLRLDNRPSSLRQPLPPLLLSSLRISVSTYPLSRQRRPFQQSPLFPRPLFLSLFFSLPQYLPSLPYPYTLFLPLAPSTALPPLHLRTPASKERFQEEGRRSNRWRFVWRRGGRRCEEGEAKCFEYDTLAAGST